MAERLIFNTSPLIALHKGGVLGVCLQLPFEFLTTPQVQEELANGEQHGLPSVPLDGIVVQAAATEPASDMVHKLDAGEASVIHLALELGAEWACIDERDGRLLATAMGLQVTGALGLLLRAKRHGLIAAVRPVLAAMLAADVRLSDDVVRAALKDAGEWIEP